MAYDDWSFMPQATDDSTVTAQVIAMYGICPGGYWVNESQGRFLVRNFLCKAAERPMKVVLYKKWVAHISEYKYDLCFAVERLNNEISYATDIWRLDQDENGFLGDGGLHPAAFSSYDANTLVWTFELDGDEYFNDPELVVYDSEALAKQALADGIWKEKTKYQEGGYSQDGGGGTGPTWGGGGLFDHSTDIIGPTPLPVDFAAATKLFRIYTPTAQQLSDFADYLFSPAFDPDTLKKLFASPMDYILGLSAVPFTVEPSTLNPVNIYIGNINTGVSAHMCNKQFLEFDMGSIIVKPMWDAYLDYAPMSSAQIFLPFCGYRDINIDEIVGQTVGLRYIVDIITGACMAEITVNGSIRANHVGQCSANIPLSATDWTNSIQGAISIAGAVGGMAATGAVSAAGVSDIAATAVNMVKPNVQRSGGFSGSGAFMGCKTPHIILNRPVQALPLNGAEIDGFPAYSYESLGACRGYTEVDDWAPSGFTCSKTEMEEIDRLLKEGVYL